MKAKCLTVIFSLMLSSAAFAQQLSINVMDFTNATRSDTLRVNSALELLEQVVNQK